MHHLQAVIEQLSADERAFFDREPAKAWLSQTADRLAAMPVAEAADLVRAQIPALSARPVRTPRQPAPETSKSGADGGGDSGGAP